MFKIFEFKNFHFSTRGLHIVFIPGIVIFGIPGIVQNHDSAYRQSPSANENPPLVLMLNVIEKLDFRQ